MSSSPSNNGEEDTSVVQEDLRREEAEEVVMEEEEENPFGVHSPVSERGTLVGVVDLSRQMSLLKGLSREANASMW